MYRDIRKFFRSFTAEGRHKNVITHTHKSQPTSCRALADAVRRRLLNVNGRERSGPIPSKMGGGRSGKRRLSIRLHGFPRSERFHQWCILIFISVLTYQKKKRGKLKNFRTNGCFSHIGFTENINTCTNSVIHILT
jgi:hypothetical protein